MKKRSLLFNSALLLSAISMNAQDMTPKNWKFSQMQLGSAEQLFIKETCKTDWNISFPYRAADGKEGAITMSHYPEGDIVTAGKFYGELPAAEQEVFDNFFSSCSIVPGGELGNLFCIKGKNTTADDFRGEACSYSLPNTTLFFMTGDDLPLNSAYRISFSIRSIVNEGAYPSLSFAVATSHYDGIDEGSYRTFSADFMPELNEYWTTYSFDINVKSNTDPNYKTLPIVVKTFFGGGLADDAMTLFRDIKIEKISAVNPDYVPMKLIEEDYTDGDFSTGVSENIQTQKEALIWNNKQDVSVVDAKSTIELYDISGQLVATYQPNGALTSFNLPSKGVYIVKTGKHTAKVVW